MNVYQLHIHCPNLHTQSDARVILQALHNSPGFGRASINIESQTLDVTTANSDKGTDVLYRLSHVGFAADRTDLIAQDQAPG
jgi:hypothetical protein